MSAHYTAEEVAYHLEYGEAVSALLQPIARVLAVIRVGEQRGWDTGMAEYRDMLHEVDRLLTKLGEVSAVTQQVQQHNLKYLKTDREPRH